MIVSIEIFHVLTIYSYDKLEKLTLSGDSKKFLIYHVLILVLVGLSYNFHRKITFT